MLFLDPAFISVSETYYATLPWSRREPERSWRGSGTEDPGSGIRLTGSLARTLRQLLPEPQGGGCGERCSRGREGGACARWAERRWVFGSRAASSPGWSSAPPRPLPPACAAGSGGGGAARGQAEALDVGRRRGQGRADGRWQRGQRGGPLGVAAVRAVALPSCSAAVSATGGPQGCVCIPVFPGPGPPGPSGRVSVRGSVCLCVGVQMLFRICACLCPREACPCP